MLNRRHIRIKALQVIFAYYNEEKPDMVRYEKMLFESFQRFRDLYISLLLIPAELQSKAIEKIEAGLAKKLPSNEDLNPNTKFVTNEVIRMLSHSKILAKASGEIQIRWANNQDLMRSLFRMLITTEDYKEYMTSPLRGFDHDKEYLLRFMRRHVINYDGIHDYLEDSGIFWNDDMDLASSMALKTIKTIKEKDDDLTLLPLWKEEDDEEAYAKNIFRKTLEMGEENLALVAANAPNWEVDRIATMDMVILKMALAEARTCESIPLKVTMNEYIELANYYSTPKSNVFINGLLESLFLKLKQEGKIRKVGRGLIEE
jgi:N utilization substance protein B